MLSDIFSSKKENLGRQEEVDLLRGFACILIIVCHVGLYLGNDISTALWVFSDLIGSEPCAPVFMALMGISIIYSRHQKPKELLKRGITFFAIGYLLSLYRSILPLLIFGSVDEWASVEAFFVVDIMQFAGLTFMLLALLKRLKLPNLAIFALSLVMVMIDQYIMLPDAVSWDSRVLTGIIDLFCPVSQWSCFPLLTWFAFPAFGLVFGDLLTRCSNKKKLYSVLLPVGLLGVVYVYYRFYTLYPHYTSYYWGNNFYYMGLKNVLLTLLLVCFLLSFWYFAGKLLPDAAKRFLSFLSKNLNTCYIISWVLIGSLIHAQALWGWRFNSLMTAGMTLLLIAACSVATWLWLAVKKAFRERKAR